MRMKMTVTVKVKERDEEGDWEREFWGGVDKRTQSCFLGNNPFLPFARNGGSMRQN